MVATQNMVKAAVQHCKFGKGTIESVQDNHLTIRFETTGDSKVFTYPDAFEKFLCFEAQDLKDRFAKDWKEYLLVNAIEEKRKQQEINRMEQENRRALMEMMKKRKKAAQAKAERERKERERYAKKIS